jgi:hypothetical protein
MANSQLPREPVYSHPPIYYLAGGVYHIAVAIAIGFVFWRVTWPQHLDQSRLSEIEAKLGQLKLERSATSGRQLEAETAVAEVQKDKVRRPIIQLTPSIVQSASTQDIREIHVQLELNNAGESGATIHGVTAQVDDGHPSESAAEVIARTQDYFYRRLKYRYEGGLNDSAQPAPLGIPPVGDYPAQQANAESLFEPAPVTKPPFGQDLFEYFASQLPPHGNCPHGKLFALSSDSPDIKWTPVQNATQSVTQKTTLGPSESTSLNFNYLLTEYPLQHNFQWLRFKITIEYTSEYEPDRVKKRTYVQILPGLTGDEGESTLKSVKYTTMAPTVLPNSRSYFVWKPTAPLMPTSVDE